MIRRHIWLFGLFLPSLSFASVDTSHVNANDLYLGEVFYYAFQGKYVDAIARQDIAFARLYGHDKPKLDPLHFQFRNSQFSVGDFESSYRMQQRAERAIKTIIESNADQLIRNEAAYHLARIFLQNGEPENALKSIGKISGKMPEGIREDELFLRAQIFMANGKFADAVRILQELQDTKSYKGFVPFNLGVALIKTGQEKQGLDQLDKAGQISGDDEVTLSIRDKANLTLGYRLIGAKQPALAKQYLDRVRLSGPFSNKALLGFGWADVALGSFDGALVPWTVLAKRNVTDKSVQESMLSVPYAYSKLNLPGKAAKFYGKAFKDFEQESARLDASIKSVRDGKFLQALLHQELQQDENWIAKLRSLPEAPETHYLIELMAANDFQASLKNYLDLYDLSKRLESSDESLNAYEEITGLRRQYYQSQLPTIDKQFSAIDSKYKSRLMQRQKLDDKINNLLASPKAGHNSLLDDAYSHLQQMDDAVNNLNKIYSAFVSLRQSTTQNYQEYDDQIRQLKNRVHDSRQKVNTLMSRQGHTLEVMAINELDQRYQHLQDYQAQAGFALAESYERASKMQTPASEVK
jgi:hypothetical protein